MSPETVLNTLADLGVRVWVEADKIKLEAEKGAITDELREQIRLHKLALIEKLKSANSDLSPAASQPPKLPEQIRDGLMREGISTIQDQYGPRLTLKMSDTLYIAVANYRRERYLASLPARARTVAQAEMMFD